MIAVLVEMGGERMLGKARELADAQGDQVLAVCSEQNKVQAQRYISLGADEVMVVDAESVGEWIGVFVDLLKGEKPRVSGLLVPSNVTGDLIIGSISSRIPEKTGSFLDGTESLNESNAAKIIPLSEQTITVPFSSIDGKKSLFSLKLNSLPEPYEDTSRYGKVTMGTVPSTMKQDRFYIPSNQMNNSTSFLTILKGKSEGLEELIGKIASKYNAVILNEADSPGRVVYGNCLAINVESQPRELPQFNGDLITVNHEKGAPIMKMASLSLITSDVEGLLKSLLP